jgi:hypothetical protein
MRTLIVALLLAAVPASAADRLTDRDVKRLLERLYEERDRFEDRLDGQLKRSTVRWDGGELIVERYLQELQRNVKEWRDRYSPSYTASHEATIVLRQASEIHNYMSGQKPDFDGVPEWQRMAATLREAAAVYATGFPFVNGSKLRRISDSEVKSSAEKVAASSDRLKKAVDNALKADKSIDKATREKVLAEFDLLKTAAKTLASRVDDGQPAGADAKAFFARAEAAQTAAARATAPAVQTALGELRASLATITQAFS